MRPPGVPGHTHVLGWSRRLTDRIGSAQGSVGSRFHVSEVAGVEAKLLAIGGVTEDKNADTNECDNSKHCRIRFH